MLRGNTSSFLISPVYDRSYRNASCCFRFRYVIFETEAKALTIYIRYANKSELFPIWTDEDSTTAEWKYGQVPITAMDTFQESIKT